MAAVALLNEGSWSHPLTANLSAAAFEYTWTPTTPAALDLRVQMFWVDRATRERTDLLSVQGPSPLKVEFEGTVPRGSTVWLLVSAPNYTDDAGLFSQVEDGTEVAMTGELTYSV